MHEISPVLLAEIEDLYSILLLILNKTIKTILIAVLTINESTSFVASSIVKWEFSNVFLSIEIQQTLFVPFEKIFLAKQLEHYFPQTWTADVRKDSGQRERGSQTLQEYFVLLIVLVPTERMLTWSIL